MLYMVVSTHSPESCPVVNSTSRKQMLDSVRRMNEVAQSLGIKLLGSWNDMPAHTTFMLVDAPKAEALGQLGMELHFMDWTTSIMHPVVTMEESMAILQKL